MNKGLIFVVSAPAGTGKTTLVRMLLEEFPHIVESVSYTTRSIRHNEIADRDYFFVSQEQFEKMIQNDEFLEYAHVFGSFYGTGKKFVESQIHKGKHVILVLDTQGALYLMKKIKAVFIFISPPSIEELNFRLHKRKSETEESIQTRLSWAQQEMNMLKYFDYNIVNDKLEKAFEALRSIVIAEEHRNLKQEL